MAPIFSLPASPATDFIVSSCHRLSSSAFKNAERAVLHVLKQNQVSRYSGSLPVNKQVERRILSFCHIHVGRCINNISYQYYAVPKMPVFYFLPTCRKSRRWAVHEILYPGTKWKRCPGRLKSAMCEHQHTTPPQRLYHWVRFLLVDQNPP